MIQEHSSKAWIGCVSAAAIIIAAIIGLVMPFAERIADRVVPPFTPTAIVVTATQVVAQQPEATIAVAHPTEPLSIETTVVNVPSPTQVQADESPIREHYQVSVGDGIFSVGTFSDGLAPYSESWLWDNNHFRIQRIRQEEYPNGCAVSGNNTNLVWISGSAGMQFTINDEVVGTYKIADDPHGYIFEWPIRMGDKLCAVNFKSIGFSIILGPDIYYHYDSYCYRGNCK